MSEFVRLAALDDLPVGTSRIVEHAGQHVLLARLDDGVRAFDGRCPHARTVLVDGPLEDGEFVECPMHGARFSAADGALEPGPISCAGLTAWPVRVSDGHVEVEVPEKRADTRAAWRPPTWGAVGARTAAAKSTDH